MRVGLAGLGSIGSRHLGTLDELDGVEVAAVADPRVAEEGPAPPARRPGIRDLRRDARGHCARRRTPVHPVAPPRRAGDRRSATWASRHRREADGDSPWRTPTPCWRRRARAACTSRCCISTASTRRWSRCRSSSRAAPSATRSSSTSPSTGAGSPTTTWRAAAGAAPGAGDGGGALMNQGAHAVDLARWLAGPIASRHLAHDQRPALDRDRGHGMRRARVRATVAWGRSRSRRALRATSPSAFASRAPAGPQSWPTRC